MSNYASHFCRSALAILTAFVAAFVAVRADAQLIEATMTVDLLDRMAISSSVDGVVEVVSARAGEPITAGQLLVQIATERRTLQLQATRADYDALLKRSQNNTLELVNAARERSARFNVTKLNEASAVYATSVPELEMIRAKTELEQAATERRGARQELAQFASEAEAKLREAELLEFDIRQSRVVSPYNGALVRVDKHPGEYVQQGETIAELYRLDRLSGVALINREDLPPDEAVGVAGRLVVQRSGGEQRYEIAIKRVLPRVDVDGRYRAVVEIENQQAQSGGWRLLPGVAGRAVFKRPAVGAENKPPEDAGPSDRVVGNWPNR